MLQVFACRAAVASAEAHLQALLPQLASTAGVRSLSYVSIQNQGNYLVELPAVRTDVPAGWQKVQFCSGKHLQGEPGVAARVMHCSMDVLQEHVAWPRRMVLEVHTTGRPHATDARSVWYPGSNVSTVVYHPHSLHQVCATKKVCRYHPPEVTQGMAALARAQEQLQGACAAAWTQALRGFTAAHHAAFRAAVDAVAQLDALHSLAVVASSPGYCRPQVLQPRHMPSFCCMLAAAPALASAACHPLVTGTFFPPHVSPAPSTEPVAAKHTACACLLLLCSFPSCLQFVEEGEPQQLVVVEGKHPMLDTALDGGAVPNSLDLRWDGTRAAVITG